jgi:hypothetical protein
MLWLVIAFLRLCSFCCLFMFGGCGCCVYVYVLFVCCYISLAVLFVKQNTPFVFCMLVVLTVVISYMHLCLATLFCFTIK